MALRIDIYDANGTLVATTNRIVQFARTVSLDKAGSGSFTLPATEPKVQHLVAGASVRVYDTDDGYLGEFLYQSKRVSEQRSKPGLTVQCSDLMEELTRVSVHQRDYEYELVDTVVSELIALVSGWNPGDIETGIGHTTVAYEWSSVLSAIDEMRDRWDMHFRLGAVARTLDFGAFGDDSGVRLIRATDALPELEQNSAVAFVTSIEAVEDSQEIFNSIIPLGAGTGTSQLTIALASAGSYAVQIGTNADGSSYYYIEDTASVAAYGRREKVLSFTNISPLTNSDENIARAADALKLSAEAYIARHLVPTETYSVTVAKLPTSVKVGDTVRLRYKGAVTQDGQLFTFIDVDEDFYVMDIETTWQQDGRKETKLTISSVADRRTSDQDVIIETVSDISSLKVYVQPSVTLSPYGPYTRRIDSSHSAQFSIRLKEEVTYINRVLLRFKTFPLRASATGAASGGGSTQTSGASSSSTTSSGGSSTPTSGSGSSHTHAVRITDTPNTVGVYEAFMDSNYDPWRLAYKDEQDGDQHEIQTTASESTHTHTVTIPSHTHGMAHTHTVTIPTHTHGLNYGLYEDTNYPQGISIAINGTDRTTELGGTWAPSNASVEQEIDITDYMSKNTINTVTFSCTSGQGEIEFEGDCLLTIQAIVVS